MQAKDIIAREQQFQRTGKASSWYGKAEQEAKGYTDSFSINDAAVNMPNSAEGKLEFKTCYRADGNKSFYTDESVPKKQVVLHFTAGYLHGDVPMLTRANYRVSTPFLIGRDGTIYNLFSSRRWSYHLGPKAIVSNETYSKQSVGIELSNIGPLELKGNNLVLPGSNVTYCTVEEGQYYTKLDAPFRGYEFYASFTDEQYESVIKLLRYLCGTYNIPSNILPENLRYETTQETATFEGIVSHINSRGLENGKYSKWDIGPAFDWDRVQAGIQ